MAPVDIPSCEEPERVTAGHDAELGVDDVVGELATVERAVRDGARVVGEHVGQQHTGQNAGIRVRVRAFSVERRVGLQGGHDSGCEVRNVVLRQPRVIGVLGARGSSDDGAGAVDDRVDCRATDSVHLPARASGASGGRRPHAYGRADPGVGDLDDDGERVERLEEVALTAVVERPHVHGALDRAQEAA